MKKLTLIASAILATNAYANSFGPLGPDEDLIITLETPVRASTQTGVGSIRGWAFHKSERMDYVDIYIDDRFWSSVPVGGTRADVYNEYPDYVGAYSSGYDQTINYKNLQPGFHTVEVWAHTIDGNYNYTMTEFCVEGFVTEFISDPSQVDLTNVNRIQVLDGNRMLLENVSVEGHEWEVELAWSTASQGFEITSTSEYECSETVDI